MISPVPATNDTPLLLPIEAIDTRSQIRTRNGFDRDSLAELAESIKARGILQRLLVTPKADEPGRYWLVAGERRLLAASMAQMTHVPVDVRHGDLASLAADQAVENLQRENLAVADIADGLNALAKVYGKWQDVAKAIGKSPSWVSKHRRLCSLSPMVTQVMREELVTDAESLVTLDHLARAANKSEAAASAFAHLVQQIEARKATRETIRGAAARLKAPAAPTSSKEQANDETDETDEAGDDAPTTRATKAKHDGITVYLTAEEHLLTRAAINTTLQDCTGLTNKQRQMLEALARGPFAAQFSEAQPPLL